MLISKIEIYKYSIPMHPFTIATGKMDFAQNTLLKIHTSEGLLGYGECSAFPMIVGETQNTCYEMAKEMAPLWLHNNALAIPERMAQLHAFTAGNTTIKSAFDMALYDIAAQHAKQPLYAYLGGKAKPMVTDITVGINSREIMAAQALGFVQNGATILKVKLGTTVTNDVNNIEAITAAVGKNIILRVDANQGWSPADALDCLTQLGKYNIQFCEQPMRTYNDHYLPKLLLESPIAIMADESVYNHNDALRIITAKACSSINIKLAKSGGIQEAIQIVAIAQQHNIPCMMGGMLESRLALTAFAHFAAAHSQIQFYDMDTCMLGHKTDPVLGGLTFDGYTAKLPTTIGLGATVSDSYLQHCQSIIIQ